MGELRSSFFFKAYFPKFMGIACLLAALFSADDSKAANSTLVWEKSPDTVSGYIIFYGEQSVLTNPSTAIDVGNVLQNTLTNLTPGRTYYFAVKAYDTIGQSIFSNEVTYTVPSTSTIVSTSSVAVTSILTTTSSVQATTSAASTIPPTTTSIRLTTTTSLPSTTSSAATTSSVSTTSLAPTTTTSTPPTGGVTLIWEKSPDTVSGYILFYGEQSVLTNPSTSIDVGNVLGKTFTNLSPGRTYYFAVKAYDTIGQSIFSNEVIYTAPSTATTTAATSSVAVTSILTTTSSVQATTSAASTVPPTTTSIRLTTTTSMPTTTSSVATTSSVSTTSSAPTTTSSISPTGVVTLVWDQSPDSVNGYILFYGEQSVLTNPSTSIDVGNVLGKNFTNLSPGRTYYFAVKAYDAIGQSIFSNEVTYTVQSTSTIVSTSSVAATSILTTTSSVQATTSAATTIPSNTTSIHLTTTSTLSTTTTSLLTTSSTSTSTLLTTSSTSSAVTSSTTTTTRRGKKLPLGGKGASILEGSTVSESSGQSALSTNGAASVPHGAITIFDGPDVPSQLSLGWNEYNNLNGEARIVTGDIDGDGKDEIIIGLGPVEGNSDIPGGKFKIIDDDLTDLGWGQIEWSEYNSINGESWPACGDIDGDGMNEILIGLGVGGNGKIEVFKFQNSHAVHASWITLGWTDYCNAGGGVRPACGNLTADIRDEIIIGLYPVNDVLLPQGKFEVLDSNAQHLAWGMIDWPDYNALNGETRPTCGNIDYTAKDEILLGLGPDSGGKIPIYVYESGKLLLKKWLKGGFSDYRADNGETRLSCGDIDDDGLDEVFIGFAQGGQGILELHDDAVHNFKIISRMQIPDDYYNSFNGETYPAIMTKEVTVP